MKYIIVSNKEKEFHIMYKKHWYNRWKYYRDPRAGGFQHILTWRSAIGAQTFINQITE